MAALDELVNPFTMSTCHKLFEALRGGKKSGQELLDSYRVCKTVRQIQAVAGTVNRLSGIRVRVHGSNPNDPKATWSMEITSPSCPLIKNKAAASPLGSVPTAPAPTFSPTALGKMGSYVPVPDFQWMLDALKEGDNLFFHGPTGSGKTVTGKALAKEWKAKFIRQNFDGETVTDNMIGATKVTSEDGVSVTEFQDGELARACRLASKGERVVYQADEVTAAKPEVLFRFHRVLEREPDLSRTIEVDGEELVIPPGMLSIIATANSFKIDETGLFQGTQAMNAAFLNRWSGGVYYIDYAPNEEEILTGAGIHPSISNALVAMARGIRIKAKAESNPVICSTRQIINIGTKAMKWGCRKAIELIYLNTLLADERKITDDVIKAIKWPK